MNKTDSLRALLCLMALGLILFLISTRPILDVSAQGTVSGGLQTYNTMQFTPSSPVGGTAIDLTGQTLVGVVMPTTWDDADLTFQGSIDNSTFRNMYDSYGYEYTVQAISNTFIIAEPDDFAAARYLKIRSGTSGTPVTQSVTTTLTLIFRPM